MKYTIEAEHHGERLDLVLSEILDISRARVQKYIEQECVLINGVLSLKNKTLLKENDIVDVVLMDDEEEKTLIPENIPLDVLYEDDDLMFIHKAAGMIIHPGSGVHSGTLANALAYYLKDITGMAPMRPGIVHRLDKDTSGLLVVAKNIETQSKISQLFAERKVEKFYYAIVVGEDLPAKGTIEAPIIRHPQMRIKMIVSQHPRAKKATTHFDVLQTIGKFNLVRCHLITGRTHQIRVHFESIGYPLMGDDTYGDRVINKAWKEEYGLSRQFLHATHLAFEHPVTNKPLCFDLPLPEDLQKVADAIGFEQIVL